MRRTALSSLSLNPNCTTCLLYHFHSVASLSLPLFIWTGKIIIVSDSKNCYARVGFKSRGQLEPAEQGMMISKVDPT